MATNLNAVKRKIVRDTIRRFYHLPKRTIAKHVLNTHGELFDNDLEKIRSVVRKQMGVQGKHHRDHISDTSLFRPDDYPVKMPKTWRKIVEPYYLPEGTYLELSDLHIPFHEPKPIEQAIRYGQANKVDGIFINGDLQDCASISYWPTAHRDFNREIEAAIDFLDFLEHEFPRARKIYKPGNHEYRLPRYFVSKAPDLAESPLAAMETVIGFEERGIEFLDYFQIVYAGKLPILHGNEVPNLMKMVNPARGLFLRTKSFAACSHCHITSEHTSTNIQGDYLTCWSFGCLCDLHPDWTPYGNDWNWGFAIIHVEKDGDFEVENKRILPSGDIR